MSDDLIKRSEAIKAIESMPNCYNGFSDTYDKACIIGVLEEVPTAQSEEYTELKQEFIRMASYIDVLLECSDEQKETLIGFISRLAEFVPWTERD